jgi:PAS domain-containing protein
MGAAVDVWKETIDRSVAPVLIVGRDQTVSYANRAAHEFLDYPAHSLSGLSLKWLSPPSTHDGLARIDAIFAGECACRIEGSALRSDGSLVDVTMIFEPCLDRRGDVGAVSVRFQELHSEVLTTVARFESVVAPAGERAKGVSALELSAPDNDQHSEGVGERLDSALQLLRWLAARITSPRDSAGPDDARERARMLLVLRDATELVHECRRDLQNRTPTRELPVTRSRTTKHD